MWTLPPRVEFLYRSLEVLNPAHDGRELFIDRPNHDAVEKIGQRVLQLRASRRMTQVQLHARSGVSRSYLSRIEQGQMKPSLRTLEKISQALEVGVRRLLVPESSRETLMKDPLIQGLRPFLRQLDCDQWQLILKRLAAISDHVADTPAQWRPFAHPQSAPMNFTTGRSNHRVAMGRR